MSEAALRVVEFAKRCPGCGEAKPRSEYHRDATNRDGCQVRCKQCVSLRNREKRKRLVAERQQAGFVTSSLPKRCPSCGETKPPSGFYEDLGRPGGQHSQCKKCTLDEKRERRKSDPDFVAKQSAYEAQRRRRLLKDPDFVASRRVYNLNASFKSRYGITTADAREMLRRQLGLCANRGCGAPLTFDVERNVANRAQVDHCHTSGSVRGILCRRCNTGAGIIEKNENAYLGLLEYLSNNKQPTNKE